MGFAARVTMALVVVIGLVSDVVAQSRPQPQDFKIEWKKRTDPFQRPGIEGWVANPSGYRVGSMQLKVETIDADNKVSAERKVWVYGHVPAGGRAFFVVPLQPDDRATYRITVDSFDLIALESP